MKTANKFFMLLAILPFLLMSCGGSFSGQLKREMQRMQSQTPQCMGNRLTMLDANLCEL